MVVNETADAVPGRHPRRRRGAAGGRRDHGAGRGVRRGARRRVLGGTEDDIRRTGARTSAGSPRWPDAERERLYRNWKKAVTKTLDWVDDDVE